MRGRLLCEKLLVCVQLLVQPELLLQQHKSVMAVGLCGAHGRYPQNPALSPFNQQSEWPI